MFNARQEKILEVLHTSGYVEVDMLASLFEVATQTIRRDLSELCERGLASRVHGGARRAISTSMATYEERRLEGKASKTGIADAASKLIPNGSSVAINIGTTTEHVANALQLHKDLTVITNNINVVHILQNARLKSLSIIGGEVRMSDGAIVGADAVDSIRNYKVDYAIIGASSLDHDGSVLDFDQREVAVARAIIANARTKILVCGKTKFEVSAPHRICGISQLDIIVTDATPPSSFCEIAEKTNTKIITTDLNNE